jgi:hypothetical protein
MTQLSISDLRKEKSLSLARFAELIGLSSKGNASSIERSNRASLSVALKIEELSMVDGVPRIDAASLNDDVARARSTPNGGGDCQGGDISVVTSEHVIGDSSASGDAATGQSVQLSRDNERHGGLAI